MAMYRYIPNALEYAVDDYGDYAAALDRQAGYLNNQANRFQNQANRLSNLSNNFLSYADTINDTALNNMLKYGEVDEGDLVGRAVTDNTLAYGKAWDAAQRNLTRMGINPNSGRFAGMEQSMALNRAAAEAGARNQARLQARNENFQRANALAGLGQNYSSLGLNAANGISSALSGATSAYNSGANILNSAAGVQRTYDTMLGQLDSSNRDRALYNDRIQYGRQLLGNQWGGTNTQAAAAAAAGNNGIVNNAINAAKNAAGNVLLFQNK